MFNPENVIYNEKPMYCTSGIGGWFYFRYTSQIVIYYYSLPIQSPK